MPSGLPHPSEFKFSPPMTHPPTWMTLSHLHIPRGYSLYLRHLELSLHLKVDIVVMGLRPDAQGTQKMAWGLRYCGAHPGWNYGPAPASSQIFVLLYSS